MVWGNPEPDHGMELDADACADLWLEWYPDNEEEIECYQCPIKLKCVVYRRAVQGLRTAEAMAEHYTELTGLLMRERV